jgi:F0F1-type ATP synthase beta subunit
MAAELEAVQVRIRAGHNASITSRRRVKSPSDSLQKTASVVMICHADLRTKKPIPKQDLALIKASQSAKFAY